MKIDQDTRKIEIGCDNCETSFTVITTDKHEPTFCCFCGEPIKLYEKEKNMLEYNLSPEDEDLDEDVDLDEDFDLDEDDDFDEDDDEDED